MKNTTYVLIVFGFLALATIAAASGATSLVTRFTCKNIKYFEYNFDIGNSVPVNRKAEWRGGHVLTGNLITPSNNFVWENVEYSFLNTDDVKSSTWIVIPFSNALEKSQNILDLNKCYHKDQNIIRTFRSNNGKPEFFLRSYGFYTQWYHGVIGFVYSFLDPSSARRFRITAYFENIKGKKAYLEEPKGHIEIRTPYISRKGDIVKIVWTVMRDVANFTDSSVNKEKSIIEVKYGEFDVKKWKWINRKQCFVIDPNKGRMPHDEVQCHGVYSGNIYITNNHIKGFFTLACAPDQSYMFSCDISGTNYTLHNVDIYNTRASALDPYGRVHAVTYPFWYSKNAEVEYIVADGSNILYKAVMKDKDAFYARFTRKPRSIEWQPAPANSPVRPFDPLFDAQIVFGGTNSRPYLVYDSLNIYKGNLHMYLNIVPVNELFTEDKN